MLLYSCDGSGVDSFTDEQLRGSECLTGSGGQGDIKLRCLGGNLVGAWAVGGTVSGISEILTTPGCDDNVICILYAFMLTMSMTFFLTGYCLSRGCQFLYWWS